MKRFPAEIQYFRLLLLLFSPVSPLYEESFDERSLDAASSSSSSSLGETSEAFLCGGCGGQVFHTSDGFVHRSSPSAASTYTLSTVDASGRSLNVSVQRLVNPQRASFDLITVKRADTKLHGKPETEASWFDGYAWTVSACPRCGRHLGWKFTLVDDAQCPALNGLVGEEEEEAPASFHGLILSQLVREKVISNLIKLPKIIK